MSPITLKMSLNIRYTFFATAFLALTALASCSNNDEPDPQPATTPTTVLVYMVADNSLGAEYFRSDEGNLDQMRTAVINGALKDGGRILVYHDGSDSEPSLFEITPAGDKEIAAYSNDMSSLTVERMRQVITDARAVAPAEQYGLVLWSHGTGWIETSTSRSATEATGQSFGQDKHPVVTEMKVSSLAEALRPFEHRYIYFDCCFMATVEVCYELRECAPTIIAYATEIPVEGMPYATNPENLAAADFDPVKTASTTMEYYVSDKASNNSCAIAVVDTKGLEELAAATREIMSTGAVAESTYSPVPFFRNSGPRSYTYDMADYVRNLPVSQSMIDRWNAAYSAVVIHSASTPQSYGLNMSKYSGLGCYIVRTPEDASRYGYRNQAWWNDVVSYNPTVTTTL